MKRISFVIAGLLLPTFLSAQASIRFKVPGQPLWGLKYRDGKTVVPATYYSISDFKNGRYIVYQSSLEIGMMNEYGNILLPATYRSIYDFGTGVLVRKNGQSGVLNRELKEVLPLQYEQLQQYDSFYIAKDMGKFGVLDTNFVVMIPFTHGIIYPDIIRSRHFMIYDNGRYGLIDIHNKVLIPQEYEFISGPQHGFYIGIKTGKITLFDQAGRKLWDSDYKDCIVLGPNDIAVKNQEDNWAVVNRSGKVVIPFQYHKITAISEGMYIAQNTQNLWGAVTAVNKIVIPFEYIDPFLFKNGIAPVQNRYRMYGYINIKGKALTEFKYDKANLVTDHYAKVVKDNQYGLLDTLGKEVLPPVYQAISVVIGDYVYVVKDKEHYILNLKNAARVSEKYAYISIDDYLQRINGKNNRYPILARNKEGMYGYIDVNGEEVTPFMYNNAGSFIDDHASVYYKGELVLIDRHGNILPER